MNNVNSFYQKTVRIQTVVCGLLFSIFSFVYLYVFQCDVLEALHFSLAHGKTHFSALGSAIVITLILLLLRWGVNCLVNLKGKVRSLAYLPSFFVLMALSDVGRDVYLQSRHSIWIWLLPVLIGSFIAIAYGFKKGLQIKPNTDINETILIGSNVGVILMGCFMTLMVGNTETSFHHELQIEKYLRTNDLTQAMQVGERSLEATRTFTALRAFSLSKANQMGERLFAYPQHYGSNGLFFSDDSLSVLRYTNDSIYQHLGARPYNGENRINYLKRICYENEGKYTALDYYLSALLLEKQIDTFATVIPEFYEEEDSLPKHYREALVVYQASHPNFPYAQKDSILLKKYTDYCQRQTEFSSKKEESNRMRREYGDTYWWYYHYQK